MAIGFIRIIVTACCKRWHHLSIFFHRGAIRILMNMETVQSRDKAVQGRRKCTISRNGPTRFRVNGPTLHGLPAEPQARSFTRPFCAKQVFWL